MALLFGVIIAGNRSGIFAIWPTGSESRCGRIPRYLKARLGRAIPGRFRCGRGYGLAVLCSMRGSHKAGGG